MLRLPTPLVSCFALGVVTIVGCSSSSDQTTPPTTPPATSPTAPSVDAGSDAPSSSTTVDPTPDELASRGNCPAIPTGDGTKHEGTISADETWTAAGSPHKVTSSLNVRAKLTIEPCAVVLVEKNAIFTVGETDVGGSLVTKGTSAIVDGKRDVRPVIFDALTAGAPWGPLVVQPKGTADLAVTALLNGGADNGGNRGALMVRGVAGGTNDGPLTRNTKVDRVLVEKSATYGVNLEAWGTFAPDSDKLWVRKSGSADYPSAIRLEPGIAATLPKTIVATDNLKNELLLSTSKAFMADDTFVARGLPYRALGAIYVSASKDGPTVTLKVEPGVTVAFDQSAGSGLLIGSSEARQGVLEAIGTAASPIVFTSAKAAKAPGDWVALYFRKTPSTGSRISYAKIEFAGGDSTTSGFGCGPQDADNDAAVIILGLAGDGTMGPSSAWIDHTTFENNAGATGIVSGWVGDGPSFAPTNTFGTGSASCHVSQPQRSGPGDVCQGRRGMCN